MANREAGELDITIGGKVYTMCLTTNAMVALEEAFSTPDREVTFQQILVKVNAGSVRHQRGLIWASLLKYQPKMTIEQAGELIQEAGGLLGFASKISGLVSTASPDVEDLQELRVNPPEAQAGRQDGTGERSTSMLVGSA